MESIIAILVIVVALIILRLLFYTSKGKVEIIAKNKRLDDLTDKFPENKDICRKILSLIGNKTTKIEEDDKTNTSLYLVITDKILIANIKQRYVRIQTIAHECIHSMQDKKVLWFNFIFSNIYLLYFIIISVLTIAGVLKNTTLQLFILAIMGFVNYMVRSYLESDAIIKARYLAKAYMRSEKILKPEEVEEIVGNYDILNKIGVPLVNYDTAFGILIKLSIYAIIAYVITMI